MAWDKVSTVLAVTIIIFQMESDRSKETLRWSENRVCNHFTVAQWRHWETRCWIIYQPFSTQRIWNPGVLTPDLASFHLTLVATWGICSMWERSGDESEKMWTTQQLVPSHCEQSWVSWWRTDVPERHSPLQPRPVGEGGEVHQSRSTALCKLIKLLLLLAWICVFWHEQRRGWSPTGSSFSSAKHTKYVLSQNNCPLLPWRLSKTQWLARCPEIDHFIIKQASQGNKCFGRKANRQKKKKKNHLMVTNVFAAMTKDCCDFFFFFSFFFFLSSRCLDIYCWKCQATELLWWQSCYESISGLFFCCYAVSIIDSE